ncbi:MAG: endo-alpha-N-acetylgalactosaminidase family protein [bacterium]
MKSLLLLFISFLSFASFLPRLLSLSTSGEEVEPGGRIYLSYKFQNVGSEDEENYLVFVHARIRGTDRGFGGDFAPFHPTSRWRRGEIIEETSALDIPPDAPKGEYVLYIGFYSPKGRIEMDNKEIEREGWRYEVFSFKVGEKRETKIREKLFKQALSLAGIPLSAKPLFLESEKLKLTADENYPFIREVIHKETGERFTSGGESVDFQLELIAPDGKIVYAPSTRYLLQAVGEKKKGRIIYRVEVREEGREIMGLKIWFELKGEDLLIGWGDVKGEGYFLSGIRVPILGLNNGKLALPLREGRLVDSSVSFPHREIIGIDCWRSPLSYSCVYGGKAFALLEPESVEDKVIAEVRDNKASLGMIFNCHTPTNPPLFLQPASGVCVHFGKGNWLSAAAWINGRIKGKILPIYKRALVYKIFCDVPQAERPITTFEEALEIIKKIHNLTLGIKQIVYLVGWQYRGHDTGYPAIDKVNERLGGREGLLRLMEEAKKFNAIVSFHDNYDDAYMDSPAWNEDFICRTPQGELVKGGVWAGGQSYIINPKRYVEGGYAKRRVEQTFALYPIKESYHIDVLSAVPLRYSYSGHTCTGKESVEYKKRLVEMFKERGVDVSSELVTQPFLGVISFFWHLTSTEDAPWIARHYFLNEEIIPFVPACIHSKAIYGQRGYLGGVRDNDVTKDNWREFMVMTFLETLPSLLFSEERIVDFKDGRIIYPSGWWSATDEVFYKGRYIRKGGNVFLPISEKVWLAFSDEGGEVEWELPDDWQGLNIYKVEEDGKKEEVGFSLEGRRFKFEAKKRGVYEVVRR